MLHIDLDRSTGIAVLTPDAALSKDDFDHVVQVVDPFIEAHGELKGLIIYTKDFPGWESFGALVKHLTFVRDHHRKLSSVALVSDSKMAWLGENVASHFVSAEIKHFPYSDFERAKTWVKSVGGAIR